MFRGAENVFLNDMCYVYLVATPGLWYKGQVNGLRHAWLDKLNLPQSFYSLEDTEKIHTLLNDVNYVKHTAQFIVDAFNLRSKLIYLGDTR